MILPKSIQRIISATVIDIHEAYNDDENISGMELKSIVFNFIKRSINDESYDDEYLNQSIELIYRQLKKNDFIIKKKYCCY